MSKHFRPWNIDQTLLLPPSVQDFVPKDHVSRFIVGLVRESLDLKEIAGSYVSGLGQPPFDPRMMIALLLHGYASGLYSSRRIARACRERNDFVMIVALDPPDFRTISDFRKRHLKALGALFLQVLKLCETAGLAQSGILVISYACLCSKVPRPLWGILAWPRLGPPACERPSFSNSLTVRLRVRCGFDHDERFETAGEDRRRRWRRWRPTPSWPRRKSAASRPKRKAARR